MIAGFGIFEERGNSGRDASAFPLPFFGACSGSPVIDAMNAAACFRFSKLRRTRAPLLSVQSAW